MDVRKLRGIAVVAIENGEKVGSVSDVLFDTDNRRVYGFAVGSGGLFGGTSQVVEMSQVQSIGTDAIMIPDRNALRGDRSEDRYRGYPDLGAITSLRAVTQSGSYAGNLTTVRIDEKTGAMTELEISPGGLTSAFKSNFVVPIDTVVSIGKDVAIIPDDYSATAREPADEKTVESTETTDATGGIATSERPSG